MDLPIRLKLLKRMRSHTEIIGGHQVGGEGPRVHGLARARSALEEARTRWVERAWVVRGLGGEQKRAFPSGLLVGGLMGEG